MLIVCLNLAQVKRAKGWPEKTWIEVILKDMNARGLNEDILLDRKEWRWIIHVVDPM